MYVVSHDAFRNKLWIHSQNNTPSFHPCVCGTFVYVLSWGQYNKLCCPVDNTLALKLFNTSKLSEVLASYFYALKELLGMTPNHTLKIMSTVFQLVACCITTIWQHCLVHVTQATGSCNSASHVSEDMKIQCLQLRPTSRYTPQPMYTTLFT